MNTKQNIAGSDDADVAQSVAGQVLQTFINALGENPDLADIAARLKVAIIDKEVSSEAALRLALFGEEGA